MNKNKDILLDILEKNWEPEQIYNMFPNPSPWKNEIEQEKQDTVGLLLNYMH